jgi:hypothetical protein
MIRLQVRPPGTRRRPDRASHDGHHEDPAPTSPPATPARPSCPSRKAHSLLCPIPPLVRKDRPFD